MKYNDSLKWVVLGVTMLIMMVFCSLASLHSLNMHMYTVSACNTEPAPAEFQVNTDTINALNLLFSKESGQGRGFLSRRPEEAKIWASASHNKRIITANPFVCEIGFAIGYSALAILSQHPTVTYVGFDEGGNSSITAADALKPLYPQRFRIFWGDSSTQIRELAKNPTDIRCDVWIIDGDHSYEGAQKDFKAIIDTASMLTTKHPNNVVLWDDVPLDEDAVNKNPVEFIVDPQSKGTGGGVVGKGPHCCTGSAAVLVEASKNERVEFFSFGQEMNHFNRRVSWAVTSLYTESTA